MIWFQAIHKIPKVFFVCYVHRAASAENTGLRAFEGPLQEIIKHRFTHTYMPFLIHNVGHKRILIQANRQTHEEKGWCVISPVGIPTVCPCVNELLWAFDCLDWELGPAIGTRCGLLRLYIWPYLSMAAERAARAQRLRATERRIAERKMGVFSIVIGSCTRDSACVNVQYCVSS